MREQVSTEGLKNMINFKKGSGETESSGGSSANSTSPGGTSNNPGTQNVPPAPQPTGELSLSTFVGSPKDSGSGGAGLSGSQKTVPIVYSEDNSNDTKKNDMEAMAACTKDDVLFRNWLIRFINSQMLLKGIYIFFN